MKLRIYDPVVMAFDLRHRRFGYAAFLGHKTLLEWGQRVYPAVGNAERELARKRIAKLITGIRPDLILLKRERWERGHSDEHLANVLVALQDEAQRHSIPIRLIQGESVKITFSVYGCETKYDIAEKLTRMFPELLPSLPPRRRPWQAEHPRMRVFEAVALGVAYWFHEGDHIIVDRRTEGER
jgi:hypothetical protein